ncbi:Chitin synthase, class 3 [Podochytrium sp. JEL0797]|nr:Chitin synthase, class 3 [Podochytrium sp. JEL0797]
METIKQTPDLLIEKGMACEVPLSMRGVDVNAHVQTMARRMEGRVPMILIVKCGNEQESDPAKPAAKPGNRGKRDSLVILMNFLSKFFKMFTIMGANPEKYGMYRIKSTKGPNGFWVPNLANSNVVEEYSEEDRFLSTMLLTVYHFYGASSVAAQEMSSPTRATHETDAAAPKAKRARKTKATADNEAVAGDDSVLIPAAEIKSLQSALLTMQQTLDRLAAASASGVAVAPASPAGNGKVKKAARAKRDPSWPSMPVTSFRYFMNTTAEAYKEAGIEKRFKEVMTECGEKWRGMSDQEKQVYVDHVAPSYEEYHQKMAALGHPVGAKKTPAKPKAAVVEIPEEEMAEAEEEASNEEESNEDEEEEEEEEDELEVAPSPPPKAAKKAATPKAKPAPAAPTPSKKVKAAAAAAVVAPSPAPASSKKATPAKPKVAPVAAAPSPVAPVAAPTPDVAEKKKRKRKNKEEAAEAVAPAKAPIAKTPIVPVVAAAEPEKQTKTVIVKKLVKKKKEKKGEVAA